MVAHLEALFPGLRNSGYQLTSPRSDLYNCVAWAAGDRGRWWWPDLNGKRFWPAGVPRSETVEAFVGAFASLGYVACGGSELEPDCEKIAFFADADGLPLHAARQLADGQWTSKVGELEDIIHTLRDLEGTEYGTVVQIMKRVRSKEAQAES